MNSIKAIGVVFAVVVGMYALAGDSESDVEIGLDYNVHSATQVGKIIVQSVVDETVLYSVKVNRGNCKVWFLSEQKLEKQPVLKYGQSFTADLNECSIHSIKEVEVTTSAGTFTFEVD